jgi:hypothetical protein
MNAQLAAGRSHSRGTIMAELATVLRNSNESTNIESAIAQTSISAQDIAANFGGNRELIVAMVSQLSDSMSAPLTRDSTPSDLRQRLLEFGQHVTDIYASDLRGLYRIAITESIRHTGLGRDFYEAGPGRLTQRLADFLQSGQDDGALNSADPHLLASHFLASLRANLDVANTFSNATRPVADAAYVRKVVDLFFDGIIAGDNHAESA